MVAGAGLVVILWGIAQAQPLLVPLCIAALLTILMAPVVRLLRRARVPEPLAIALSALILITPFSGLGYVIVRQGNSLVHDFPTIARSLNRAVLAFANGPLGHRLRLAELLDASSLAERFAASAGQGIQLVLSGLAALLGAGSQLALVLLFTILMLASRRHLRRTWEQLADGAMLDELIHLVERFLVTRLIIAVVIGGVDLAILTGFQVQYPLLLAAFLGAMTVVPGVGFILSAIPPLIVSVATGHSLLSTLLMLSGLSVMALIEGNILTPKMVGTRLNINALATFVGLFAGGLLWGIWGALLSVPILGILRIALSASPRLRPWGELLAQRTGEGAGATRRLREKLARTRKRAA